ncbi:GGDEF domain-containing protein [Herbaspirillum sp. CAH-3]|uniref:sensor domain-containing diguanylate cyclase n=1 Tax=Herbaspirillum sp. CAH-3 TaxID=2605746 RepID=UPI0012AC8A6E|nr:GGDEF domain-containing protein [Herbaspirillum sp. CAH-3]MRT27548.1 GGDEF domain-containing protein [Herbaspirillum sp. CAH-3]
MSIAVAPRFRAEDVLEQLHGGLIMLDARRQVLLWNAWVARCSRVPAAQALGTHFDACFDQPVSPALLRAIDSTLNYGLPAVLSSALHRSPLPLYPEHASAAGAARMVQSVVLTPFDNEEGERLCLMQISDASNSVRREKMLQSRSDVLKRQVATDGLTGIHNRRHFDEHYAQTLQRMGPTGGSLSLFMVDVDFFKQYNDHYGHGPGDQVLKRVAAALQAGLQRPGDLLARYGGEEFILLMEGLTPSQAAETAETLRESVHALAEPHAKSLVAHRVTISVGVCTRRIEGEADGRQLMATADAALYRAKLGGRNKVVATD